MAVVQINFAGRSLPERILYSVLLLAVLVLGFFFLVAALIAGAVLASALGLRYWWLQRKARKTVDAQYINTEYTVVEREPAPASRLPHQP